MNRSFFGTDGVRGIANEGPMTPGMMLRLAQATAQFFQNGDHRHKVVIGKDTRLSCYMIEQALTAGFLSMGMDVVLLGPMPTPAVALMTRSMRADLGVMITASHNPYHDNGVKVFAPDGFKLSDEQEVAIEKGMDDFSGNDLVAARALGRANRLEDAPGRYIEFAKSTISKGLRLDGLKIVLDCANGAGYKVAPTVLWELGAEVVAIHDHPNGFNINDQCGATYPKTLQKAVLEHNADIGIALDGDADRLIVVDEKAQVIDGDQIIAVIARHFMQTERLAKNVTVATVMSNMGLERYLNGHGINLHRTQVGDRYVLEALQELGANVGGEQSGHVILSDYATTGDGLVAALQLLSVMQLEQKRASELFRAFDPMPQTLKNIRFQKGSDPLESKNVKNAIDEMTASLGNKGRILVRKSGTEPLIRIMVEAEDEAEVKRVLHSLSEIINAV